MQQSASARRMLPAGLTVLGGVLLLVGSLLPWLTVQVAYRGFASTRAASGLHTTAGKVTLIIGIAMVAGGAAMAVVSDQAVRRVLAVAALTLGIVGAGLAAHDMSTKDRSVNAVLQDQLSQALGRRLTPQQIELFRRIAGLEVSLGMGIYLTLAGGLLTVAGGFAMLAVRKDDAPEAPPP